MTLASNNDPAATTTAVVTIRIPCGGEGYLVTDAEERLSQVEAVADVTIDELYGIEPKLSATILTLRATLQWMEPIAEVEAREQPTEASGLESVVRIE